MTPNRGCISITPQLGGYSISYPLVLTPDEYYDLILKEGMKNYFKEKLMLLTDVSRVVKRLRRIFYLVFM